MSHAGAFWAPVRLNRCFCLGEKSALVTFPARSLSARSSPLRR